MRKFLKMGFNIVAVSWQLLILRHLLNFLADARLHKTTDISLFLLCHSITISLIEQNLKEYAKSLTLNKFP